MACRLGITIGDGVAIGFGAVVCRSVPAYHISVGSLAQVMREMAIDVPDTPGLRYELWEGKAMVGSNGQQ